MRYIFCFLSLYLIFVFPKLSLAQGLTFDETFEGKVIVSMKSEQALQIDFSGDAAKKIFIHMSQDAKNEKLFNRNPEGKIVEDVLRNSKIVCFSSRISERYFCQMHIVNE